MYKLVVLACVLAAVAAAPTGLIAAPAVAVHSAPAIIGAPAITYAAHAPVVAAHAPVIAAPAVTYAAHAPAVAVAAAPAAIVRTVNHVAYHVEPVEQHGYKIVY